MNVIGIVCEYNPFHNGHLYHMQRSRELLGEDSPVICVMSGDFVQRGEAAIYSKFARAEAACLSGADLVFELPLPWSLSSAEGFARGAAGLLDRLGATHLCFGSETGETAPLETLARELLQPGLQREVKEQLARDGSLSYAAAREMAVRDRLGDLALLLEQPNNILGVEYIKAIYDNRLHMEPCAVLRVGSGHDREGNASGFRAAAELRRLISRGREIKGELPETAEAVFAREKLQGRETADKSAFEMAILSRLRLFDEACYEALPDAADGLGRRLYGAVRQEPSLDGVLAAAKTKRYALARIRRMVMCACLGVKAGMNEGIPPYARLLAANCRGRELLRDLQRDSKVPILTKPAAVKDMGRLCAELFTLGANAHDFYTFGYRAVEERKPGKDWRTGPKIV